MHGSLYTIGGYCRRLPSLNSIPGILTRGHPNPQNGMGQKSKIFDFAQNDFGDVSDNFRKFFFVGKIFPQDLENFSKIFASEIDF